jgi:hypothetical protein
MSQTISEPSNIIEKNLQLAVENNNPMNVFANKTGFHYNKNFFISTRAFSKKNKQKASLPGKNFLRIKFLRKYKGFIAIETIYKKRLRGDVFAAIKRKNYFNLLKKVFVRN